MEEQPDQTQVDANWINIIIGICISIAVIITIVALSLGGGSIGSCSEETPCFITGIQLCRASQDSSIRITDAVFTETLKPAALQEQETDLICDKQVQLANDDCLTGFGFGYNEEK